MSPLCLGRPYGRGLPWWTDLTCGWAASGFADRRRFEEAARHFIRLPRPGEGPVAHLWPEAVWQDLLAAVSDPEGWLMALSAATGVYFFPSREWPLRFVRFLMLVKARRLLEAGAGRGYLSAALAPLAHEAGLAFKAIDKGEGEFQSSLPLSEVVEAGDVFRVIHTFQPDVILYAWPPPGQSVAPLLHFPLLRFLIVVGDAGGATGTREDWQTLPGKDTPALSRFGRGRTGPRLHRVTIFLGQKWPLV